MSIIGESFAEELAELFHYYQEALAPDFECKREDEDKGDACPSWELVPPNERKLMIATARLALLELAATRGVAGSGTSRGYETGTGAPNRSRIADDPSTRLGKEGRECGC